MKNLRVPSMLIIIAIALAIGMLTPAGLYAHCDGLDGPVVTAARNALETGNVNLVLIWVQKDDEAAIRKYFADAVAVRKLGPQAKEMADMYFFETLVRVHRTGEGAPYTGLKPAGRDLGPAIPAADKALADGTIEPLIKLVTDGAQKGIRERFEAARTKQAYNKDNVEAGREYIETYVMFIHYVEALYQASQSPAKGHFSEGEQVGAHGNED